MQPTRICHSAAHLLLAHVCRYRVELRRSGKQVDVADSQLAPPISEGSFILVLPGKGEQMREAQVHYIYDTAW